MHCNKAINKASSSCSWNILDTNISHDGNSLWKCKLSGTHLNLGNVVECALKKNDTLQGFFRGGAGRIVFTHNKAKMCTSSAVIEELVCLSS